MSNKEKIIWQGKPDKKAYFLSRLLGKGVGLPFVLSWLFFDICFIFATLITGAYEEFPTPLKIGIIIFFLFHLMPVWLFISKIAVIKPEWANTDYKVTDRKILIKTGAITLTTKALLYKDIVDVTLHRSLLDRILKTGDIYITTPADDNYILYDLNDYDRIYDIIQNTVIDISNDIEYPNALRPKK